MPLLFSSLIFILLHITILANNTELHFNTVNEMDSATYTCVAENSAGRGEEVGSIYVQDEELQESKLHNIQQINSIT